MGKLTTQKQDNNTLLLEMTYGGKEAPWGGIDTSAPPQYIAPNCFINANNFLVINERLVAVGFQTNGVSLAGWASYVYIGSGSFFANGQYNNFAIGYSTARVVGPPAYTQITYYIWVWAAGTVGAIPLTATLPVIQYDLTTPAVTATGIIDVYGTGATTIGTVSATIGGVGPVTVAVNPGDKPFNVAANLEAAINIFGGGMPVTASIDPVNNYQIILTANNPGAAGNAITLATSQTGANGIGLYLYNPTLTGGVDATDVPFGQPINPLSWVAVGETLYLGGNGTMILQYFEENGIINFSVLTQYLGAINLAKFSGQLIAAGIVPGPGTVIQSPEMVIAWSAPEGQYGIWNPTDTSGNVTGAGFNEESDISDYITGMFITPGSAAILRTQGIDYLTATQNGTVPFDFQHISNSKFGEGCQDSRLVTQYDQTGVFVGNSDVYLYEGSLSPIGAKIKNLLIAASQNSAIINRDSTSGIFNAYGEQNVFIFFVVDMNIYVYCLNNKTWMQFNFTQSEVQPNFLRMDMWGQTASVVSNFQFTNTFVPTLTTQIKILLFPFTSTPAFWSLTPYVQDTGLVKATASFVVFPQEEIMFGRDITVDGILASIAGTPGQVVNFSVSGVGMNDGAVNVLTTEFTLPATASPNQYVNYQISFVQEVTTLQNPQLRVDVPLATPGSPSQLSFAKIAWFGSFDPTQRPI